MSLKNKFIAMLSFILALSLAASGVSMLFSWQIMKHYQDVINDDVIAEQLMLQLQSDFRNQLYYANMALTDKAEPIAIEENWRLQRDAAQRFTRALNDYKSLLSLEHGDIQPQTIASINKKISDFEENYQQVASVLAAKIAPSETLVTTTSDLLSQAAAEVIRVASTRTNMVQKTSENKILLNSIFVLVVIILGLIMGYFFIKKTILDRAKVLVDYLEYIAAGDFTHPVVLTGRDELGLVFEALQSVQSKIGQLMKGINDSAIELEKASLLLTDLSHDASDSQHAEVAAIESISKSIHAVNNSAAEVAEHSMEAAESSTRVAQQSHDVLNVVNQSDCANTELTSQLKVASNKVSQLVSDNHKIKSLLKEIKVISQKTTDLVVHSAVDANQNKILADGSTELIKEVQGLADSISELSDHIQEHFVVIQQDADQIVYVMGSSISFAEKNVTLGHSAADALREVDSAMTQVQNMADNIANEASTQQRLIEDIDSAIMHIEQMADRAEKTSVTVSDATDKLSELAIKLHRKTEQFKV